MADAEFHKVMPPPICATLSFIVITTRLAIILQHHPTPHITNFPGPDYRFRLTTLDNGKESSPEPEGPEQTNQTNSTYALC